MSRLISLLLSIFSLSHAMGQPYAVGLIPDSLLKNADAVVRTDKMFLSIHDKGKATLTSKIVYTILNEKADHLAVQQEGYDKFNSIESIEGHLYDASGNKLKSLKKSDIKDLSGMGGGTDISDDRIKEYGFYHKTYPYTVEFEVKSDLKGLMFLPSWYGMSGERLSVQQSSYEVQHPAGTTVLYKAFNYPGDPQKSNNGGTTLLTWQITNRKAMLKEPYAPAWHELTPAVFLAMKEFEMESYLGGYESWEKFGDFAYQLIQGRDALPAELKQKVHTLVEGKQSTFDKVDVLYRFMQQNTRYISIQLGIGGWRPYEAGYVYSKKYGDCKALTNYMHALLKEAEIPSIYTLVQAGSGLLRFMEDFPSSQFNHAILCVPNGADTIWLECTSQTMPTGYLGDFTNNRPVLLVKEKGSRLVRTPHYSIDQNLQFRSISAAVSEEGLLSCRALNQYSAMQQDDLHGMIHALAPDKQKETLQQRFNLGTYAISKFNYAEKPGVLPVIEEQLELEAQHYAQVTGKRLMITPNILSRSSWRVSKDSTRQFDIVFSYPYTDIDSVTIAVCENYVQESLPKPVRINNEFGSFECRTEVRDGKIFYYRRMQRNEGRFSASKWQALVTFLDEITKADRQRVVLVKKEG